MGTNTFHLLVAETGNENCRIIYRTKLAVKIGKGGINHGFITPEGLQRALDAMQEFKRISKELGTGKIYAFGTSALRNAKNSEEVILKIKSLTGIDVTVISGDQEAELIYFGVRSALDLGEEKSLIIDIGGGSVEFIIGNRSNIFWKESFEIGAQRLLEKFHHHDPILPEEIEALNKHLEKYLSPLIDSMNLHKPTTLVGSSGTFDTLSDIFCINHQIAKTPDDTETPLTIKGFYEIYHELIIKNRAARMRMPGMIEMRVDMIITACCLIKYLLEKYLFARIRVSSYSLKEGVMSQWKNSLIVDR